MRNIYLCFYKITSSASPKYKHTLLLSFVKSLISISELLGLYIFFNSIKNSHMQIHFSHQAKQKNKRKHYTIHSQLKI